MIMKFYSKMKYRKNTKESDSRTVSENSFEMVL